MKHKFIFLGLIICIVTLFSGCSEQQQLHQKLIVQGVGIDRNNEKYKISVQALDFQNPMNEDEPSIKIMEVEGVSVMEALDNISKQTSLRPVYSQNLVLILGEEAAKSGVSNFIDFFVRHCETRPKVQICVSKGKASEIIKIKSGEKFLKSKNVHDLVPIELNSDVLHFVSNLKNTKTDPWAAWLEAEDKNGVKSIHLKGVGIFKEDSLIDFLEGEEAFGFMILKGVPNFGSCIVNSEECGDVTCIIEKVVPKISVEVQNDKTLRFYINLNINASTFSLDKNFYTHSFESISDVVEKKLSNKLGNICTEIIRKTLKLGIDVFEFSKILRNNYPSYFKKIESNWNSLLTDLEYKVSQEIKLKATGKEPV